MDVGVDGRIQRIWYKVQRQTCSVESFQGKLWTTNKTTNVKVVRNLAVLRKETINFAARGEMEKDVVMAKHVGSELS